MQFPNNNDKQGNNPPPGGGKPPQFPQDWRRWMWPALLVLFLVWSLLALPELLSGRSATASVPISYTSLFEQVEASNVSQLIVQDDRATGVFRNPITIETVQGVQQQVPAGTRFTVGLPATDNEPLYTTARANGTDLDFRQTEVNPILLFLFNFGPLLLIIGFFIWSARRAQRQMGGAFNFGRTQAREYTVERPQVKFGDVAGQESAKAELVEVVDFLKEPDKYIALGAKIPRGVLLVGPPGTGKTLLARAVAGEANVSFFSIAASEFVEMFVGVGASRVRDLFRRAKENAPSIVFVDEIDAVGRQRGAGLGGGHDEREQTLNQMLAEMDGFDRTESVIVMAATNRPDVLDPALLRPGRFDRQVTVGLPDKNGREAILKIHTRDKPLDKDVKLDDIAKSTIGFSGADLANLANEAALSAARRNRKRVTMRDFLDAFDRIVLGNERPPLSTEKARQITAYHEAGHALAAIMVPDADPVLKVTIVPRGMAGGVTVFMPEDRAYQSESYLRARMITGLGGRAAEQIIFNEVTTGAVSDLRQVTSIARAMVSQFGMSDAIGPLNYGDDERQPFLGYSLSQGRNYSEETAAKIDAEVHRLIEDAYGQTLRLMENHHDKLEALAQALLEKEVIGQQEMYEIVGMSHLLEQIPENVFKAAEMIDPKANGSAPHADKPNNPNTGSPGGLILDLLDDVQDQAPDVNVIPPPPAELPPPHPPESPVKPPTDGNDPVHPLDRRAED
jgi:cell division protease FtsH